MTIKISTGSWTDGVVLTPTDLNDTINWKSTIYATTINTATTGSSEYYTIQTIDLSANPYYKSIFASGWTKATGLS